MTKRFFEKQETVKLILKGILKQKSLMYHSM